MRYLNILVACAAEPWALEETKLIAVKNFLLRSSRGAKRATAEEIEERIANWKLAAEEIEARIGRVQERQVARSDGQIAIVPIYGVMCQRMNMIDDFSGGTSTEVAAAQFRAALTDPGAKAIVLDLDTPGGTTTGTAELADEIYNSRGVKPIIAQINSCAASAGYWVASAADEIVVTPGGQGGSIGVYTIHDDLSKMMEMAGIKSTIIRSGEHKIEANDIEPLTDDIRARVQRRVDLAGAQFTAGVARNRGVDVATVNDRFGRGLMFDAAELVRRGMVDRIATLPETLERFGLTINPVASGARANLAARAQATETLIAKLKAGDQLSPRELEHGLKGLAGLTNSEAERAVRLSFKGFAQGEPENKTEPVVAETDLAEMRQTLDGISKYLNL